MKPGSYRLDARVIVLRRADDPTGLEKGLKVGLLTSAPSPEGSDVHEIRAPGNTRQPVEFGDFSVHGRKARSNACVNFDPAMDLPLATHGGIFAADGSLLAYGLIEKAAGHAPHDAIMFAPTAISLKF